MNKLSSSLFHIYSLFRLDLVNRLNLVNEKGLTTTFTKSSLGWTYQYNTYNFKLYKYYVY